MLKLATTAERPDLIPQTPRINRAVWPRFMMEDPVADKFWGRLYDDFADYQGLLYDADSDHLIAQANTIPLAWDKGPDVLPAGWDDVMETAVRDFDAKRQTLIASALSMTLDPDYQGKGLSQLMLKVMKAMAARHGLSALIAPVRPTWKQRYPLTPIERYMTWTQADGAPFDPWLRTHWRLGARIICPAPESMAITGTVAQWEDWTDMRFPESGSYVVPGALQPVVIDCEKDLGTYHDPNVWMWHTVKPEDADYPDVSAQ